LGGGAVVLFEGVDFIYIAGSKAREEGVLGGEAAEVGVEP
jgi:hypothetical protein